MILLALLFAALALLALVGEFRYGLQYSPFAFKQSSIYFLFEFLFCTVCALAFYLAHKEESQAPDEKGD